MCSPPLDIVRPCFFHPSFFDGIALSLAAACSKCIRRKDRQTVPATCDSLFFVLICSTLQVVVNVENQIGLHDLRYKFVHCLRHFFNIVGSLQRFFHNEVHGVQLRS